MLLNANGRHTALPPCTAPCGGAAAMSGYSIIEVMVAIVISMMVLAALVGVFAGNSRERGEIERANQQTENGRYALQLLGDDLRNAGYLGAFNPGVVGGQNPQLNVATTLPNACATDVPTLLTAMAIPVQGYDNAATIPACLTDVRAGTDILVVRRASTCAVGSAGCDPQVGGDVYLQVSGCAAELTAGNYFVLDTNAASFTLHLYDCVTVAPLYQFRTHIYFVANDDKANDGIPTLKRAELGAGSFSIVPLVEGVDNLQIEYGLDTANPTTGTAAVYTANPSTYNACTGATSPTCVGNWQNAVTAKINVLTRDLSTTVGYTDTKTYTLGLTAGGAANVFGPYNDSYKRHLYYSVARLNNSAGRNTP